MIAMVLPKPKLVLTIPWKTGQITRIEQPLFLNTFKLIE